MRGRRVLSSRFDYVSSTHVALLRTSCLYCCAAMLRPMVVVASSPRRRGVDGGPVATPVLDRLACRRVPAPCRHDDPGHDAPRTGRGDRRIRFSFRVGVALGLNTGFDVYDDRVERPQRFSRCGTTRSRLRICSRADSSPAQTGEDLERPPHRPVRARIRRRRHPKQPAGPPEGHHIRAFHRECGPRSRGEGRVRLRRVPPHIAGHGRQRRPMVHAVRRPRRSTRAGARWLIPRRARPVIKPATTKPSAN